MTALVVFRGGPLDDTVREEEVGGVAGDRPNDVYQLTDETQATPSGLARVAEYIGPEMDGSGKGKGFWKAWDKWRLRGDSGW